MAAALAANDTNIGFIRYIYNNTPDIFSPENAKDFEYSLSRAQAFTELYTTMTDNGVEPYIAIKKASIIFDSKKVDQRVVEALRDDNDKRTTFANVVATIDEDTPEGKNQLAFAAALAADDGTNPNFITFVYNNTPDIFSPENAKDFEYSLTRAQAFKNLYESMRSSGVAPETAIKKASIIFDSKKVDQRVVEALRDDDDKRTAFADAVAGIDIDINAPEDRNKLAFAAALTAAEVDSDDIQDYLVNAGDIFQPENAKDFEYSLSRAQAFEKLYEKLLEGTARDDAAKQAAIKKASIIFDSKKVDQRVVEALRDDDDKRTEFANAVVGINVVGINGDTPEGRNKLAFAAALTSRDDLDNDDIKVLLRSVGVVNVSDLGGIGEYNLSRVQVFKKICIELVRDDLLEEVAIKKASIVFDSKKVSQEVVDKLLLNSDRVQAFTKGVKDIKGYSEKDTNKLAFAAALAADGMPEENIKKYMECIGDAFSQDIIKNFQITPNRIRTFEQCLFGEINDFDNASPTEVSKAIKRFSVLFDADKISDEVVQFIENDTNGAYTKFKEVTKEDTTNSEYYNKRKAIAAVLSSYHDLNSEQITTILESLSSNLMDTKNSTDFSSNRIEEFAKLVDIVACNYKGKEHNELGGAKLKQITQDLSIIFNPVKVSNKTLENMQAVPDGGGDAVDISIDMRDLILNGHFSECCNVLAYGPKKPEDLKTEVNKKYEDAITKFKNKLIKQTSLSAETQDLVNSNEFLKLEVVSSYLKPEQIESLPKLDSASLRCVAGYLTEMNDKISGGTGKDDVNLLKEISNGLLEILSTEEKAITSETIAENYNEKIFSISSKVMYKVPRHTVDGTSIKHAKRRQRNIDNSVNSITTITDPNRQKLREFLYACDEFSKGDISSNIQPADHNETNIDFIKNVATGSLPRFLSLYQQASLNGYNQLDTFYAIFNDIKGKEEDEQSRRLSDFCNTIESELNEWIADRKNEDKKQDERNKEEELKEKDSINIELVNEIIVKCESNTQKLHKQCLDEEKDIDSPPYATALVKFLQHPETKQDELVKVLSNLGTALKDEEDSQIIFRNIVASNGLIAYKDVLLQEPEKLTPQLLKSMAVDIGNENDTFLVLFDDEEKDKMKDTLCEGKEFEKVVRHGAKEKGKQYRLTKTEWISYLTKNRSKIKDFADLTPEDEIKFKELALLTNSSFVQDKSFCAALSRHISDMKDKDTIIYADAINKLYSIEKDAGHSMEEALENIFNKVNNRLKGGDKDYRRWFSQEELLQLNPTELSHFYDDEYLCRMQAARNANKGVLISAIGNAEKDQIQFYNRIILNIDKENNNVFKELEQYEVDGVGGTVAAGSFKYNQGKVEEYIKDLKQNYEQINSAKEIARALNNCEEATDVKSDVETIQKCVNLEHTTLSAAALAAAGADADAIKEADSRMEIKLRARNMGGRYKEKVEGNLIGLDKDVEVELLSRLSAMKTEGEVDETLTQLSRLYNAYKSFPQSKDHSKDQDEIIKYTIQNLPTNKKILTPTDFQRASLKAILKKQKISVKNQEIIFKNEKRIDFFAKNYLMFKDIDNDELTQILNKSSHEGTSDTAIDHIIEACNNKDVKDDLTKVEFIFRSSASFNGDHLRHHLKECSKEHFSSGKIYEQYRQRTISYQLADTSENAKNYAENKALMLEQAKFYNLSKQNGITPDTAQPPLTWDYDAIKALNKNLYKYENDFKLNGSLIQGVSTLSGGVVSEDTIRAKMAIAYANGGQYNVGYNGYVAQHNNKLKSFSTDDLINFGIACVDIEGNKTGDLKGGVFTNIKSSQTLAECSRLCVEKRNGKISDEAYKAKVILALAADSKTEALDQILSNRGTGWYINLSAPETKDTLKNGIKDLNTEQKKYLLKKLVEVHAGTSNNKYGLDKDFFTNLLQEDCITGVEYQHILKSNKSLHDSKFMEGVRDGLKHNDNVKVYNQIANATQDKDVKDIVAVKIQSTENEIFSYVSPDQRILYEIAGRKLTALAVGDAHSVFLNIFEDAELNDPIKKQRYAYAFAFSNQYKNDDGTIGENFSKLLNGLDKEDRSYIYTAFIEKECRNTKTNKDFAEAVLQIAQVLPDDEKKNEFAGALKKYLEFADKTHNKLDIFDELSKKSKTEKDAGILISALLDDNVSLRYGRTDGAVESTIDSAINTMTKNRNIEDQTNILYNLTKSANTQENRYLFLDGIMRHIESLNDKKIQAQLVCNLAKEFTKKENLGTDEDVKLSEQFFVKTARHFANDVDFSINLMNNFNLDNETEEKAQAELLHRFSQYSMPISTEHVINNSNVSQNKYLHDNFEFLDTGDYAKRDARSVDKILEMIGVTEEKDRKEIVRNLRFCSNIKEIKNILNGAIDDHNSRIYDSGAAPIDHITTDEEKRIQNIIASKRKSLLDKLGKGEETIHFSDENLAAVKAGASSQLQWKVNKLKEREASSKRKFGTVQDFKDLHMKRAIHAADFLSKLEYYNHAESVANDPVKKEQAREAKRQLLNEQKDEQYSWDGKHWHNWKSNRKHAARGWKRLAWGLLHIPNFVFVGAFATAWAAWPLGVAIWATIGFGLTGWGAGLLLAAGVIGSIVTTGMQVAGIMNKKRDDAWYQKFNPALWVKKNYQKITDRRNHILEKQYEDAAKATLEKSNRALANVAAQRIEQIHLKNIGDGSRKYYNIVENVGITEENKSITSRKLRKIRDTNWSMKYVNPWNEENSNPNRWRPGVWFDRIKHEVGHGTIERTADLTGAQRFVEKKLEKYNKDSLQDYTKALINLKSIRGDSNNNQPIVSNKTESEQSITR